MPDILHGLQPHLQRTKLCDLDDSELVPVYVKKREQLKEHGLTPSAVAQCLARKDGLTPVQLALGFTQDRPLVTSSIIGATSVEQFKEDIDVFLTTGRPLPSEEEKFSSLGMLPGEVSSGGPISGRILNLAQDCT
ncbi:hypothetical protein Droror1_Dr00021682 [Drosera rotundifolia]